MKKILFIAALLTGLISQAQVKTNYPQYGGSWQRLTMRSIQLPRMQLGVKDLNLGYDTAQIYYNPVDSSIYTYTGTQWILLRGSGAGGSGVTNVATGLWLSGGPITSSGTIILDSAGLATYFVRRKDSSVNGGYYPFATNPKSYLVAADVSAGYVPLARTLTINGVNQDLSANRTYNVGTVTSIGIVTPAALSASAAITTSGNITITALGTSGQYIRGDGQLATYAGGSGTVNSGNQYRLAYYATTGTAVSEASAITANRALISDANGVPTHSVTTATELTYLNGVTSAIQTQIDGKANRALSNLASVSINATLVPQVGLDLGATTTTWRYLYLHGTGTYGSTSMRFGGTPTGNRFYNFPDATTDIVGHDVVQTLTNKTITSSTNILGGVTMTLGSDANGDIYHRQSGVLTRLALGTAGQMLRVNGAGTSIEYFTHSFQTAGNYITALTGDGTATGPGSVPFTLATVNGSPGTFGGTGSYPVVTVNGKGLSTTVTSHTIVAGDIPDLSATYANRALSNLSSVSVNASLIPQTTLDLGAAATAWRYLYLYGAGAYSTTSMRFGGTPTGNRLYTFPDATTDIVGIDVAQILTNKTITSSTNILGGVTMTLGSDANGDTYYRSGGVLTRLGIGSANQLLRVNAGGTAPEYFTHSFISLTGLSATTPLTYNNGTGVFGLAGLTTLGTANQIVGMNNAGTAYEYKTVSTSTSAVLNDVGVTLSGANALVINLPSASATVRGVLNTADWSTFNNKVGATRNINTTSPITGGGDLSSDRTIAINNAVADASTKGAASFETNDFNSTTGNISLDYTNAQAASGSLKGFLTSTDWTTFNNKLSTSRNINTTSPITGGGDLTADRTIAINNSAADGTTKGAASFTANDFDASSGNISLDYVNGQKATASVPGFLSQTDWSTFSGKENALTFNSPLSRSVNAISITNAAADGSTKGVASFTAADFDASSGNISLDYTNGQKATTSIPGFLSSTDWTTFNNKVATTRTISTTSPLTGGGDLSANRTLAINDAAADASTKGASTYVANDFNSSSGLISIDYTNGQAAATGTKGFLTSTDWNKFNVKADTVQTYTGMRAYTGGATALVNTDSRTGGVFYKSSTGSENGATVIVDGSGNKWVRQFDGVNYKPEWYEIFGKDMSGNSYDATNGNGIGSEADAIANIVMLAGKDAKIVYQPNKIYEIDRHIPMILNQEHIGGKFKRAAPVVTRLSNNEAISSTTIEVVSATGFQAGMEIVIKAAGTNGGYQDNSLGTSGNDYHLITAISGNTLTIAGGARNITRAMTAGDTVVTVASFFIRENGVSGSDTNFYNRLRYMEFDGNKAQNRYFVDWQANAGIQSFAYLIAEHCKFFNYPGENMYIAGGRISDCFAYNGDGSVFHWSNNQAIIDTMYRETIVTNLVADSVGLGDASEQGHSEAILGTNSTNSSNAKYINCTLTNGGGSVGPRKCIWNGNAGDGIVQVFGGYYEKAKQLMDFSGLDSNTQRGRQIIVKDATFKNCGFMQIYGTDIRKGNGPNNIFISGNTFINSLFYFGELTNLTFDNNNVISDSVLYYNSLNNKWSYSRASGESSGNYGVPGGGTLLDIELCDRVNITNNRFSGFANDTIQKGIQLTLDNAWVAKNGGTNTLYYYPQNYNVSDNEISGFRYGIDNSITSFTKQTVNWKIDRNVVSMGKGSTYAADYTWGIKVPPGATADGNVVTNFYNATTSWPMVAEGINSDGAGNITKLYGAILTNNKTFGLATHSIYISPFDNSPYNVVLKNNIRQSGAISGGTLGLANSLRTGNDIMDATNLPAMTAPQSPFTRKLKDNITNY